METNIIELSIAKDFTKTPGGRYIKEGPFSGEEFYISLLKPKYDALHSHEKLKVDFDGTCGYPPSFVSEAFSSLYKDYGDAIWDNLILISNQDPGLIDIIHKDSKDKVNV